MRREAKGPCVVTGAGRGLGRALALHLTARGLPVALCARRAHEVAATAAEIEDAGGEALGKALDVSDVAAVHSFARDVAKRFGPPWAVINNAALLGPVGRIEAVDLEHWLRALVVDVGGIAAVTQVFVPQMRAAGGGRIVNLSGGGIGGADLQPRVSAYTASKGAVSVLTEVLARELASDAITVNAVAPGPQPTAFLEDVLRAGPEVAGPELYRTTIQNTEQPESLENFFALVDYLVAAESDWLTGKLLSVRWDHVNDLRARRDQLVGTSLLTLRRIDDEMFCEVSP
jgi:NAD(P)-dependent dehydrogenase (short-subunit alcohol dehydrogenase family)